MGEPKYPATHMIYWPGKTVAACAEHKRKLEILYETMVGKVELSSRRLLASEKHSCHNCINEGEKK